MEPIIQRIQEAETKARISAPYGVSKPFVLVASKSVVNEIIRDFAMRIVKDLPRNLFNIQLGRMEVCGMEVVDVPGINDFAILSRLDMERLANAVGGVLLTGKQLDQFNEFCDWKLKQALNHPAGQPGTTKKENKNQ